MKARANESKRAALRGGGGIFTAAGIVLSMQT